MTNSKGSSVVRGDERAQDELLAVVVLPDGSSETEHPDQGVALELPQPFAVIGLVHRVGEAPALVLLGVSGCWHCTPVEAADGQRVL